MPKLSTVPVTGNARTRFWPWPWGGGQKEPEDIDDLFDETDGNDEGKQDDSDTLDRSKYPRNWNGVTAHHPGDVGFNQYLLKLLKATNFDRHLSCDGDRRDRWYQNVLNWLVHPKTPIRRLLITWQLGLGKTIGMLRVLDNWYDSWMPKILLFPTPVLVDNFNGSGLRLVCVCKPVPSLTKS
jgi:hypothetical protein